MIQLTYQQLKAAVEAKGYAFFDKGDHNLNIVGIRSVDEFTNAFDDTLCFAWRENGDEKVLCLPGTTKPGTYGAAFNPVTVMGVTGTGVLIPGQYRGCWEWHDCPDADFGDWNKTWSGYPYMQQVGALKLWRDGNRDTVIDHVYEQEGMFGINLHQMSMNSARAEDMSGQVNNWSEGCQGARLPDYLPAIPVIRAAVAAYGIRFSYTLLMETDLSV
jgi:hypothetical protein